MTITKKKNSVSICLKRNVFCQEWDSNPRLHSKTRRLVDISLVKDFDLESDSLDHTRAGGVKYSELKLGGTMYVNFQYLD